MRRTGTLSSLWVWLLAGSVGCAGDWTGPPDIVLVSIDTFRADRLGILGNPGDLTPNLDRFGAESVVFRHAYSQATITGPSHASMFTGRYPSEVLGSTSRSAETPEGTYTLPGVLATYGYETAAFVAGGDLNPEIGPTRGFETYQSSVDFGSLWHTVPMAMSWLDDVGTEAPFFLFVHGYDTHSTYLKPTPYGLLHTGVSVLSPTQQATLAATERILDGALHHDLNALDSITRIELRPRSPEARARFAELSKRSPKVPAPVPPEDEELVRRVYDGAASYADAMFGVLLARLEARGVLEDAVVIVMGDHGEALGEDGLFHRCCGLDDALTHVPLFVRLPRGEGGGRVIDGPVELVDILPTALELAGATPPAGIAGRSLGPALRGEPFQGRRAAMSQGGLGMRILSARSETGRITYTGVQVTSDVVADVVEAARIDGPAFAVAAGTTDEERSALRTELVAWLRGLAPPPEVAPTEMSTELRDKLRAKGYWDAR